MGTQGERQRERRKRKHQEKRRTLEKIRIRDAIERAREDCNDDCFMVRRHRVENRRPSRAKDGTHVLGSGTVTIQDAESLETVAIAKFTPLKFMTRGEKEDVEALTTQLVSTSKTLRKITINSAHKDGTGDMWALGWRGASDGGYSMGRYVPNPRSQRSRAGVARWLNGQVASRWMSDLYRTRFQDLSRPLFDITAAEAYASRIPSFGDMEFGVADVEPFAGNLTFTMNDFGNHFHTDHYHNSYTYGLWAPVVKESGKLASRAGGFRCDGGEFVISSYNVCLDLGACDGITEVIWRSNLDEHKTFPSTTDALYTRLGSSTQIPDQLVQRVKVIEDAKMAGREKRTRGIQSLLVDYAHSRFPTRPGGGGSSSRR